MFKKKVEYSISSKKTDNESVESTNIIDTGADKNEEEPEDYNDSADSTDINDAEADVEDNFNDDDDDDTDTYLGMDVIAVLRRIVSFVFTALLLLAMLGVLTKLGPILREITSALQP